VGYIAGVDTAQRLNSVKAETLVLVGETDPSTPVASAEMIVRQIPNADLCVLANCSHMTTLEVPELVNEKLLSFLHRAER
jgi:pimeloyl-ACP methyl ester carboxylesterase